MSSPPLDLFLVRHGVTDWNEEGRLMGRADIALSSRGRTQAEAVAVALGAFRLRAVLASPQRRAQETAERIALYHGLDVETDPALAEVWLGRWQGKRIEEMENDPDLLRYFEDPMYGCEAIESASAVVERTVAAVERQRAESGSVALVSHGDPLRVLLAHFLGLELAGYRRLHVSTGSVSVVRLGARHHQILAINWQPGGLCQTLPE